LTDESQLQVRPKDSDSSLSLSRVSSGLIARGLRDAAAIARRVSEPIDILAETRRLAEQGDADAQYDLGNAYRYGEGVAQDRPEAMRWYRKAAEQGRAEAQQKLGDAYYFGWGIPQDYAEAVEWYRRAAEQGDPDDPDDPYREGVYYDARESLAHFFPRDYVEVESKAAEQGVAEAQYGLAGAYWRGKLVPQDYAEAAKWCRKAAEQGHAGAQYELGQAYYNGQGLSQDYVQAYMWTDLAASVSTGNQREYASARDEVAAKMTPQQIAEAQRLAREWKPKPSR
jgi:TPR repeat protein